MLGVSCVSDLNNGQITSGHPDFKPTNVINTNLPPELRSNCLTDIIGASSLGNVSSSQELWHIEALDLSDQEVPYNDVSNSINFGSSNSSFQPVHLQSISNQDHQATGVSVVGSSTQNLELPSSIHQTVQSIETNSTIPEKPTRKRYV